MVSSSNLGWVGFGPGSGVSGETTAVRVGVAVRDVCGEVVHLGLWEPLEQGSLKTWGSLYQPPARGWGCIPLQGKVLMPNWKSPSSCPGDQSL